MANTDNLLKHRKKILDKNGEKSTKLNKQKPLQFDAIPKNKSYQLWARSVIAVAVLIIVYFILNDKKERKFALQKETIVYRFQSLPCSESYLNEIKKFPTCVPKTCGRMVTDDVMNANEVDTLLSLAKSGLALGGSTGGASILDLHSGALSKGENFVNIYKHQEAKHIFQSEAIDIYKKVKTKIMHVISDRFGMDANSLYLTHPTFFSRITNATAKTIHDEYWHPHVDKETYSSFHYTSLLYLTNFGKDFKGGRFTFVDGQEHNKTISTIEPKIGRLSVFTSGAENVHYVEKVLSGTRYAITISFTCNKEYAISDPAYTNLDETQ